MSLADSYRHCETLARRTGKNFYYSFLTLPRDRYQAMCALYAFMRVTDDLGDSEDSAANRALALADWKTRFEQAWNTGESTDPILPAVIDMLRRHNVPTRYLTDVIAGVEMDLNPVAIQDFDELNRYCYHVAGAVGLACIHVWGFHDERAIPLAIDCGTALQLTNILRDVREDALLGRVYLPAVDLEQFGVRRDDLTAPVASPQVIQLLEFQARRTRQYYERVHPLFQYLDPPGRPILETMIDIYGGLLSEIERRRFDVFSRRVELGKFKKLLFAARNVVRHKCRGWFGTT
ncbi:MAG: phytoene/squalene synthase family protein [Planctomycetota bacterium]|nr:phytoene/squalene synthase family protein [Planctomycetota bacterium]